MDAMNQSRKIRIAHLAEPTATIQNTPPLVTSNKARAKHGLPLPFPDHDLLECRRCKCQRHWKDAPIPTTRTANAVPPAMWLEFGAARFAVR
jgi:hypothetical protein